MNCSDPTGHDVDFGDFGLINNDERDLGPMLHDTFSADYAASLDDSDSSSGSGGPSTPDGNGGKITVTNGTITDTKGKSYISFSPGSSPVISYGNEASLGKGFTASGSGSYNLNTGASSHTFDLGYVSNAFNLHISASSNGTYSAMLGWTF